MKNSSLSKSCFMLSIQKYTISCSLSAKIQDLTFLLISSLWEMHSSMKASLLTNYAAASIASRTLKNYILKHWKENLATENSIYNFGLILLIIFPWLKFWGGLKVNSNKLSFNSKSILSLTVLILKSSVSFSIQIT